MLALRTLGLVALLAVACAPAHQPGRPYTGSYAPSSAFPDTFVVASYNVQYGERIDQALQDLRDDPHLREAGLLFLQEMQPEGVERIASELGYHYTYYAAAISPHHDRLFGNAVLSRWPIVDHSFVALPRGGFHTGTQRIAVVADVDLGGQILRAVTAHTATPALRWERRLRQVTTMLEAVASHPGPVIVAGDFNTVTSREVAQVRRLLRAAGFEVAHLPPGPTASRKWLETLLDMPPLRLDHVYFRGFHGLEYGIVTRARASDHLPIWARLARLRTSADASPRPIR